MRKAFLEKAVLELVYKLTKSNRECLERLVDRKSMIQTYLGPQTYLSESAVALSM